MAVTQNIPNTRLTNQQTFTFLNTDQGWTYAVLSIDRTVSQGLNTLTAADTLTLGIDRSPDGGTTWIPVAGITCVGGVILVKGVTLAQDTLTIGVIKAGEGFRVNTTVTSPVRVAGTLVYQ